MSDLLPPLNAVELWDFSRRTRIPLEVAGKALAAFAYEYAGSYSDGGEYYVPIPGREPVRILDDGGNQILIAAPSPRIQVFCIIPGGNPADPRAFLDTEGAYLPLREVI